VAGGTLENAQAMMAHESPRTMKLNRVLGHSLGTFAWPPIADISLHHIK
jgi:hypothetical protein